MRSCQRHQFALGSLTAVVVIVHWKRQVSGWCLQSTSSFGLVLLGLDTFGLSEELVGQTMIVYSILAMVFFEQMSPGIQVDRLAVLHRRDVGLQWKGACHGAHRAEVVN
jgi:hypothetical protein